MSLLTYRKDIDGLRALAILPVVLFHAFPTLVPGGFVGVDIFFVISGYLITSIITKEHLIGQFSLKSFYARRIRRIFPVLALVLIICLLYGWIILTPEELQKLGKYIAGGSVFIANFLFWKDAGYFDPAADTKPVLHLWSLGIEEQFYILFPLLLIGIKKYISFDQVAFIKASKPILLTVVLISFFYSVYLISHDSVAAFYSPLARAWELGVGALLAFHHIEGGRVKKKSIHNLLAIIGLALLFIGFFSIHEDRSFPGYWALLPVLGTVFLLQASNSWLNQNVLSHQILVGIGLLSYSWYLWHWPLLSFSRIMNAEPAPDLMRAFLLVLSLCLAYLSYRMIEKPLRKTRSKYVVITLLVSVLMLGVVAQVINKSKGFPQRQFVLLNADPNSLKMGADRKLLLNQCGALDHEKERLQTCYSNSREFEILFWGDSKAEALFYGFARESQVGIAVMGNMPPLLGGQISTDKKDQIRTQIFLDAINRNEDVKTIVIVAALRTLYGAPEVYQIHHLQNSKLIEARYQGLKEAIDFLSKKGKQIIVIKDHPAFPDPKSCIGGGMTQSHFLNNFFYRNENPRCHLTYQQYQYDSTPYHQLMTDLSKEFPFIKMFDLADYLCNQEKNICPMHESGQFLYSYGDHLSDYANSKLAKILLPQILNGKK